MRSIGFCFGIKIPLIINLDFNPRYFFKHKFINDDLLYKLLLTLNIIIIRDLKNNIEL